MVTKRATLYSPWGETKKGERRGMKERDATRRGSNATCPLDVPQTQPRTSAGWGLRAFRVESIRKPVI